MYLSAWFEGLTPEMVKKAEVELGETPEVRRKAVAELTKLLKGEPYLEPRLEEKFLVRYLRAKKYNVDKAYKTLLYYYYFKSKFAYIFTHFKPSQLKHVLEMNCLNLLPLRDKDGASIGLLRMGEFDPSKATPEEFVAASLLCAEIGTDSEATLVCGSVAILDLKGVTFKKMLHFSSVRLLSLFTASLQDCIACRVKGLHVVNEPYYFSTIIKIIKPFLHKKIRDRVHHHGSNLKSLHQHIPPEILPEYLGGHLRYNNEDYISKILSKESYFEEINKYGYPPLNQEVIEKEKFIALATNSQLQTAVII
ncbi:alpha-tocopherol transfer protein-like [Trichonephila inaurata madagascariensis]|uniref:Alpha-tocopherol transfer protein-like n=1 Tax=Trichonephila inaurata madagascariensis TaxID=2747483 RepID=A0A8X7CG94_9ARAC|nr:alpha-tocopherol transfer protein-like [Trichonephila inaurata madagascariensis]